MLAAVREHFALHAAIEQVEADLEHVDGPQLSGLLEQRHVEVGHADQARLARPLDLVHRPERLLEGRLRIGPVHQIHVDVVGAQTAQAVVDLAQDRGATGVAAGRTARARDDAALGGDHRLVAPTVQCRAERLLGVAGAVRGRGVEAGDALLERAANGAHRFAVVDPAVAIAAHRPAAERDRRDVEAGVPELALLHAAHLLDGTSAMARRSLTATRRPSTVNSSSSAWPSRSSRGFAATSSDRAALTQSSSSSCVLRMTATRASGPWPIECNATCMHWRSEDSTIGILIASSAPEVSPL